MEYVIFALKKKKKREKKERKKSKEIKRELCTQGHREERMWEVSRRYTVFKKPLNLTGKNCQFGASGKLSNLQKIFAIFL